jgi:hypothetical protein
MTNIPTVNTSNENIHALLNIIQNNGNINLSPYDDPFNVEDLITYNTNHETNNYPHEPYIPLYQEENSTEITTVNNLPSSSNTKDEKLIPENTSNRKGLTNDNLLKIDNENAADNNDINDTITDDDIKLHVKDDTKLHIKNNIKHIAQDEAPNKIEYHYGVKKSTMPSTFKKYQPPFAKKTDSTTNLQEKTTNMDKLIISLLENKKGSKTQANHPPNKEPLNNDKINDSHVEDFQHLFENIENNNKAILQTTNHPYTYKNIHIDESCKNKKNNKTLPHTPTDKGTDENKHQELIEPSEYPDITPQNTEYNANNNNINNYEQDITLIDSNYTSFLDTNKNDTNNFNPHIKKDVNPTANKLYMEQTLVNDEPITNFIVTPNTNHYIKNQYNTTSNIPSNLKQTPKIITNNNHTNNQTPIKKKL